MGSELSRRFGAIPPFLRGVFQAVVLVALAASNVELVSCTGPLVNLTPLNVDTWPGTGNQVLASGDTVRVSFSSAVVQSSAQGLLNVSSAGGTVSGDLSWSGNTLRLTPTPALSPGLRYNLEYNGQVTLTDGRQFNIIKEVPFYYRSASALARVSSFIPADGASTTVTTPLVLTFDSPVDATSFQTGFTLSPSTTTVRTWSADQQTVTIAPTSAWTAATLYSWQLATTVHSVQGIGLAAAVSHSFLTNADQVPPSIVSVVPGVWASSAWSPAGTDLNTLIQGDALLITTSKAVDLATLGTALHLTPTVKGHLVTQSTTQYVYVFDENFALGAAYSLQITTDLKDTVGNAMLTAWLTSFTPQIPYLAVTEIDLTGNATATYTSFSQANTFPVCSPLGVNNQVAVRVVFNSPFSAADKALFGVLSFLQPYFPTSGTSTPATPTLVTVTFENNQTVVLTYQGLTVNATSGAPDYYQFKIPGGTSGLTTQAGQALKGDVWINFATGS